MIRKIKLLLAIWIFLTTGSSFAGIVIELEKTEESINFAENAYILHQSTISYDPMDIFNYYRRMFPDNWSGFDLNSLGTITMSVSTNYTGRDTEDWVDRWDAIPISAGLQRVTLNAGTYWNTYYTFSQPKQNNPDPNKPSIETAQFYDSAASMVFPKVVKIPLYMDISLLNNRAFKSNSRNLEMAYHTMFRYDVAKWVSFLSTNIWNKPIEKHAGCPVIYKFEFFGYVSGFASFNDEYQENLPDGITIVGSIERCNGDLDAAGCGETGGRKIAIDSLNYILAYQNWRDYGAMYDSWVIATILHEIGHNYGLEHIQSKPDEAENLMYSPAKVVNRYIARQQCTSLSKPGVLDYFQYTPWEGYFNAD